MPKITTIIPIYNAQEYINTLANSLSCQTLQDFEIVFVDDGSTDSTVNILEDYAAKDSKVKIFKQQNQGQGSARNKGIAEATGEYIYFADQDDWIDSDLFEVAYNKAKEFDADIVELFHVYEYGIKSQPHTLDYTLPENQSFDYKINKKYLFGTSFAGWSKFVKRDLVISANIKFSECRSLEDYIYTVKAKINAKKIISIEKPNYHYVVRADSDLYSKKSYKMEAVTALNELKEYLKSVKIFKAYKKEFIKC